MYKNESREEVQRRFGEMQRDLLTRIADFDDAELGAFRDPDVQALLTEAQVSYARSGRDDVKRTLVDLIAARCSTEPGGLQAVVTTEAVEVVRKITRGGIAILTVSFLVTRVQNEGLNSLADLDVWARQNISPFLPDVPVNRAEFEHLASTGTAIIDIGERSLVSILPKRYPGLFQRGLSREEISDDIWELQEKNGNLFRQCLNNEEKIQVLALNADVARSRFGRSGAPDVMDRYVELLESNLVGNVEQFIRERLPAWSEILDTWNRSELIGHTNLTSVGVAIAHCNWTNTMKVSTPLSVWIPD